MSLFFWDACISMVSLNVAEALHPNGNEVRKSVFSVCMFSQWRACQHHIELLEG